LQGMQAGSSAVGLHLVAANIRRKEGLFFS
jgi:hypothetical protein